MQPILILQMQRMGDLVLTFPLMLWLTRRHPGTPLWVVGEKAFFETLYKVGPEATYFPWEAADRLARESFSLVVNLSIRDEAARLAGRVRSEAVLGPVVEAGGSRRVHGDWQLYRASLVNANRHNRYHWAELNALDAVPAGDIAATRWPQPRRLTASSRSVGVFLGASEAAKRPDTAFYEALCRELTARELVPVLLGGPAEAEEGAALARRLGRPVLSMAGRLKLNELALAGQTMGLLVTPDTGPMHLAAWTGQHVLNLSMGPVNPWETGPYQPGHAVLQAAASCAGCWSCARPSPRCRETFSPARVAALARELIRGGPERAARLRLPGQALLTSGRELHGLYSLATPEGFGSGARERLGLFWHAFFGTRFGALPPGAARDSWQELRAARPELAAAMQKALPSLARPLGRSLSGGLAAPLPAGFWRALPPALRPLGSWLEVYLANADYAPPARVAAVRALEEVSALLTT